METAPPGTVPPVRKSLSPAWSETRQALVPRYHGNMNRWMDGQVMTILGSQLGPGKGSDGLQFTPWGDAVLLGSRLDLEKLLGRQALGRGPVPPDTAPLRVAGLSCPAGMHLLFAFWSPPSGVLTGGP